MHTFVDRQGRSWSLTITVATVKRVRAECGVDLLDALGGELLAELASDPVRLCDLLWAIVRPQAEQQGVTDEQFGEALAGDVIDDASRAFLGALSDFFARPDHRQVIRELASKIDQALGTASDVARTRLDALDVDQLVRNAVDEADRKASTSSG